MSKYLSREIVLAAYSQLRRLSENPSKQGQTQKTSALRYVAALDAFGVKYHRNCDTNNAGDKKLFIDLVGDVVTVGQGVYTSNFFDGLYTLPDYRVGSNFYSANVVPNSALKPQQKFPFPKRMASLFGVQNMILLVESIEYQNLLSYLPDSSLRLAFIVWLMRFQEFTDEASNRNLNDELNNAFTQVYSEEMRNALWAGDVFSSSDIAENDIKSFSNIKLRLDKGDILGLQEVSVEENEEGLLPVANNLIYFGAPGTGKSHQLDSEALGNEDTSGWFEKDNVLRVTFHPDYTYAQFVGSLKPQSGIGDNGKHEVYYEYVPGPFLEVYASACLHPKEQYLLIIEELNRANPAAVFGDLFQLLDRKSDRKSQYSVNVPHDMKKCLERYYQELTHEQKQKFTPGYIDRYKNELSIPANMYIWATMNSADQGVFPMDTAFKRRWDFRYIGIDAGESVIEHAIVPLGKTGRSVLWNDLRRGINRVLLREKINEDKLLGPFFIDPSSLDDGDCFIDVFKSKVLLYLYEDAAKTKKEKVFARSGITYSSICADFDTKGFEIFKDFEPISFANNDYSEEGNSQSKLSEQNE